MSRERRDCALKVSETRREPRELLTRNNTRVYSGRGLCHDHGRKGRVGKEHLTPGSAKLGHELGHEQLQLRHNVVIRGALLTCCLDDILNGPRGII